MSVFKSTHLSDYLKKEIECNLLDAYTSLENIRFSVRSSACGKLLMTSQLFYLNFVSLTLYIINF